MGFNGLLVIFGPLGCFHVPGLAKSDSSSPAVQFSPISFELRPMGYPFVADFCLMPSTLNPMRPHPKVCDRSSPSVKAERARDRTGSGGAATSGAMRSPLSHFSRRRHPDEETVSRPETWHRNDEAHERNYSDDGGEGDAPGPHRSLVMRAP